MESAHDVKPRLAEAASRLSSKEIPCIFCKKLWESRLTIINDKKDILGALDALGVKYESIPGVMDYACYKCVYRINVIIDFRRLLERNINKTRANYYYALGNKDMCRKFLVSNDANISNTVNSASSDCLNLLITDVRSEREPERTADFLFDCFNDPDMYSLHYTQDRDENALNTQSRLLEPMFETEFADANNGGMRRGDSKYKNYNNLNDSKYNYKCQFCTKTYKRVYYLKKHERKHRAQLLRKDSTRSVALSHTFRCERCHDVFESKVLLKNHQLSHRHRIKCSYCTAEFYLRHDLDLHEAKCYGEISAKDDAVSVRTYYTRSRTKPRTSLVESENESSDCDTLYKERMRNVDDWVENVDVNYDPDNITINTRHDDDNMSVSSRAFSFVSAFSRASTAATGTSYTDTERSSMISARVEERVTYEKPKFNKKLLSTKSSVYGGAKRTRNEVNRAEQLELLDNFLNSQSDNEYSTPNWQRIRNRAKRENKAKANKEGESRPIYYCQYSKCYFFHESLLGIMDHDIEVHLQLPLYRCTECSLRFTRPNYLQCHKMDHPAKHHPCHLCNNTFEYIHELKYHLELHAIRSHKCPFCPRSFLKETELESHIAEKSHLNMGGFTVEHHRLFDDSSGCEGENPTVLSENCPENSGDSKTYQIYYRPQVDTLVPRMKYERVRWKLAQALGYSSGINQLAEVEPVVRDGTNELPIEENLSKETTAEKNDESTKVPAGDISSQEVPAVDISSKEVPADDISSKEVPAGDISSKEVPADVISSKEVPADVISSKEVPAGVISSEVVPPGDLPSKEVPVDDISEAEADKTEQRPETPVDFEALELFSTDAIEVEEVDDDDDNNNEMEKADNITLSRKRKREQWAKTLKFPKLSPSLLGPSLPSYSSICESKTRARRTRLRILPLPNNSQPSRFPL